MQNVEANLRICKFPEHDFVPVGTLTLIQAATVCQGLRPYYCATSKKGFRPIAEIWSGLHACTIVHVCLRVWVPSCTKWKYRLWKPSMKIYRVSKKNWVLPNWAFGDPAASWEEILMIFKENLQMLNLVKLSFFLRHPVFISISTKKRTKLIIYIEIYAAFC